jgi:uncharacterized protein (TIGR02186 family)
MAALAAGLALLAPRAVAQAAPQLPKERIEVDVSSRQVAVTSSFSGTEIVVFGTVENSRQQSAESGYYDVIVVVEGAMAPIVARKKSNVGGLWVNTSSIRFASLPIYYAIASTRPIDEIADTKVLDANGIGFSHVPMKTATKELASGLSADEIKEFRNAIVRLKGKEGLYVANDYAVAFIGRSLFRATVELPANVPVGPVKTRVYLVRAGEVLSESSATVTLSREGFELLMYNFAHKQPLLYGLFCVALAVVAGLLASALFRKGGAH